MLYTLCLIPYIFIPCEVFTDDTARFVEVVVCAQLFNYTFVFIPRVPGFAIERKLVWHGFSLDAFLGKMDLLWIGDFSVFEI